MTEAELAAIEAMAGRKPQVGTLCTARVDREVGGEPQLLVIIDASDHEEDRRLGEWIASAVDDRKALLAEVRALRGVVGDMQDESNAYHAGIEAERKRCAGIVAAMRRREIEAAEEYPLSADKNRNAVPLLTEAAAEIAKPSGA
jgi:hypothetical protein